jgi:RNA polymerase sigma-70 factor (ECF subfamily)
MEPSATYRPIAAIMEKPALEIEDFDGVVRLYWARIFRFILASARDRDVAESLTQDCFLRAYRGRQGFRGDSSLQTWLMQIAINLVRDYSRSRRLQFWRRSERSAVDVDSAADWIPDGDLSPEARTVVKQQVAAVWRATAKLSERQRTVFLLRFVEDMALFEIAEATGLRIGTVKAHLFRALQSVREQIGGSK